MARACFRPCARPMMSWARSCRRSRPRPDCPRTAGCGSGSMTAAPPSCAIASPGPMPFAVASTGTWVVTMAAGADVTGLPENRSCLVNVDALGSPVPCGLFLGGREYAQLTEGASSAAATPGDIAAVIRERRHAGTAGRELRRPFCRPALGRAARAAAGLGRRDRRPGEPLSRADDGLLLRPHQGHGTGHRRRQPERQRALPGRARRAAPAGDGAGLQ